MKNVFRIAGAGLAALLLAACDLTSPETPFVSKPSTLHPEDDLFAVRSLRSYSWTEGFTRGRSDTVLQTFPLQLLYRGDTLVDGATLKRVDFGAASGTAQAGILTQMGLRASRLQVDSTVVRDPGLELPFPEAPALGWRLDTTAGDWRFVRKLINVQVVNAAGKDRQCWVFADTAYWGGTAVSTGTYWMGTEGLVRHRVEWKDYTPFALGGGTLWREIKAK